MMELHQVVITALSLLLGGFLLTGSRRRFLYMLYKTLPRDVLGAYRFLRVNILLWWWEKREYTVARVFSQYATAHPEKIAYIFEDKEWKYKQLEQFSNRIGRYFRTRPFSRNDSIALVMEGRPEYIGTWLGLNKAGFVAALVNTNLRHETLLHSIHAAGCKAIIFGSELKDAICDIKSKIPDIDIYQWSESADTPVLEGAFDLNMEISSIDPGPLIVELDIGSPRDKLIYIYTSGTTGMPKAAVINNLRYMLMTCGVNAMLNLRPNDRIYNPLPLYHTAGGIIGAGQALIGGVTVVLRRRFSASKFWTDCVHYECTIAQYIGEICRFLLTVPPGEYDNAHKIRLMFGNGLRPQIWESFVKRFGVKQIGEFYGATEGNSNLVNIDNTVGAVGFVPRYASMLYPVALLRVDDETGEPLRGPDGFCIPCKPGEPGVFVGKINPKKAINDFSGYADKKASEQKIIHDVFKKGDRVFNSGDILIMDEYGYFFFKDRTGDTFRWRGENVATSEVEAIVSNVIGLKDAAVYGVEVPGNEGKAGMAAIYDPNNSLDIKELAEGLKKSLPVYARPLFIRVLSELPMTGTFKLKKKDLQQDAFDIKKIKDPVYFLNKGTYVRMTDEFYNDILHGKIRL
ncbi:PREDICTED: long-chain fatty acid transport protein 4 [Dinoponera quadriceps]|uniref:Very long-chain fatty acid transport protein n=1 Tax=Dinoponera quadriceps TaxID=609295 RepID=A0A6P3XK72_DINQU|nr:PREDICTED: long-chain fatty acid transport protein 4 [Dinoponera quadriceps]XP_014478384.1 PREDICTED: long-chain fatty acid transport protein 4 [Dinoponera quadriceps]